ncbi:MAG: thioredoxin fold domain-containing protein [Gammaproteobacteria bacterium]|nr:MAG: thioredoxin [Gammaproteobacteria bacterium]
MKAKRLIIFPLLTLLSFFSCSDLNSNSKEGNELNELDLKLKLEQILPPTIEVLSIQESDVRGYYTVNFKGLEPLFISKDGKYLISGDILEITDSGLINKSEIRRNNLRKESLAQIDQTDFISFKPSEIKHEVFVFTDVDCGYCRKFHSQIKEYLDLGIQVNYLAFPRTGTDSESFNKIVSAWCSSNPNKSITELKLGYKIEENICDNNPVQEHFNLGNSLGVSGTPSIITSEGRMIPGYVPPEELMGLLES